MSNKLHISKLGSKQKNTIYYSLIQNGCDEDTAKELMSTGTLQDIEDYIEVEEVLYAY